MSQCVRNMTLAVNAKLHATYRLKVELTDREWEEEWDCDLVRGEEELFKRMVWEYTEGNHSCDCGRKTAHRRAHGLPFVRFECGDSLVLVRLTVIRTSGLKVVIYER